MTEMNEIICNEASEETKTENKNEQTAKSTDEKAEMDNKAEPSQEEANCCNNEKKSKDGEESKFFKSDKKAKKECEKLEKEINSLKEQLSAKEDLLKEQNEKYLRLFAEYDNYRKRTQAEKDAIYSDACQHIINCILPVVDTLEMALSYQSDSEGVVKGVAMTLNQFNECLEKLGVSEIECSTFDPNLHNAVMHIEDEQLGEGAIVQVLRKGYKKGDKVIRHAMVKVAN